MNKIIWLSVCLICISCTKQENTNQISQNISDGVSVQNSIQGSEHSWSGIVSQEKKEAAENQEIFLAEEVIPGESNTTQEKESSDKDTLQKGENPKVEIGNTYDQEGKTLLPLKERLTPIQFEVTQNAETEPPYENPYWNFYEAGIYVDIIDGTALFSSTDKFDSKTGWPSFSNVISKNNIIEKEDTKLWFKRTEIIGKKSDSHLGHLFYDGPKEAGGLRYCINSAALKFIPKDSMKQEGYQNYLYLFE